MSWIVLLRTCPRVSTPVMFGGGDDDGKRRMRGIDAAGFGGEAARLLPARLPFGLHGSRFVGFGNFGERIHEQRVFRVKGGKGTDPRENRRGQRA